MNIQIKKIFNMNHHIKYTLLFIFITMVLIIFSTGVVFADNTVYTEGTLNYTIDNESVTIIGCFGKDREVTVPAMIAGTPVNTISKGAFTDNSHIEKLNLPDTITTIESGAISKDIEVLYNANTDYPSLVVPEIINSKDDNVSNSAAWDNSSGGESVVTEESVSAGENEKAPIAASDLQSGDVVNINGKKYTVTSNSNGTVSLTGEDGVSYTYSNGKLKNEETGEETDADEINIAGDSIYESDADLDAIEEAEGKTSHVLWILIAVFAVALAVVVGLIIRQKRKKME